MKKTGISILFFAALAASITLSAQNVPVIEWQKSFGGTIGETANSVLQSPDGGFVFAGYTKSTDGDISGSNGKTDYWVVKMDQSGNLLWQQSLGGSDHDAQWDFQLTDDGGYVIAGQSKSADGDLILNKGEEDYWIVRLDEGGNIVWQRSFGGSSEDEAYSVQQTMDGGFIVAGYSESNDGDVTGNHGEVDYWVIKLDGAGNLIWQKSLGGSDEDEGYYVQQTADGGFVIVGESESDDGDVTGNHGEGDYWIVKLDANGNLIWEKSYGGSSVDYARMVKRTTDDGFVIAGWTSSNDGDISGNNGDTDYWIVKLNAEGELQWEKNLGGSDYDFAYSINQTADQGFIVAGYIHSNDMDVSGNHGSTDYWLVKLDASGNLSWQKTLGGTNYDQAYAVQQASDGGYIIAGLSFSNDGDVSGNHSTTIGTTQDCWVVKLSPEITGIGSVMANTVSVFPNPVKDVLTIQVDDFISSGSTKQFMYGDKFDVLVYDATGIILKVPVTFTNTGIQLITAGLFSGYYSFQIVNHNKESIARGKFVKQSD
ncbi:MAG: T9SS C-terminal target domain-containing protein [Chitinophagaceae bacterium]|nr:T9SS C-terminal target domain-containing protein [Chitinophagaceae bacterium]